MALNYDPNSPVYAAPDTTFNSVDLDQSKIQSPSSVVDKDTATVAGQLKGILSSGSPLLQAAEAKTMRAANARGLLNTSMAAGEGTKAMIETATPIAQQDASLYGTLTQQNNQAVNNSLVNSQVANLEFNKDKNTAEIQGKLKEQDIAANWRTANLDKDTRVQLQEMTDTAQMSRLQIETDTQKMIKSMGVASEKQQSVMGVIANMGEQVIGSINSLLANQDLDFASKQYALSTIMSNYKASASTAAAISGLTLSW
jgi:hypothetical protein